MLSDSNSFIIQVLIACNRYEYIFIMKTAFIIICAWLLDAVLGDPESLPHPVRWIGRFIKNTEGCTRSWFEDKKAAGVFIGILAMRFVAQWFVRLLEKFPFLEYSAFIVIGILGLKLFLSLPCHFWRDQHWAQLIESESADLVVSLITAGFFFIPLVASKLLNWPRRQ